MDAFEAIRVIVNTARMIREDSWIGDVADGADFAFSLAENVDALVGWLRKGGSLPGDTMPWDGGNDLHVRTLVTAIYRHVDAEDYVRTLTNGVRLADLITMLDTNHLS